MVLVLVVPTADCKKLKESRLEMCMLRLSSEYCYKPQMPPRRQATPPQTPPPPPPLSSSEQVRADTKGHPHGSSKEETLANVASAADSGQEAVYWTSEAARTWSRETGAEAHAFWETTRSAVFDTRALDREAHMPILRTPACGKMLKGS
ncbi:glucose-1-phosphate adenylyltransferase large subunit 2, chloroplastic [Dorcoceras hygrometricum]|uniref:Glucose-1-phosphate adenylyltransferase large subunit 2, chloroplastic n=1 Tax=Dorcoceras hygrometricum TaxID=472368 RepID=A0A2Z7ABB6_9LAMI|nr:glucose-1-phosphate adenylyltransferase large subunit 2, chloroplastic [Dorcoceras hygrometricum]